MGTVQCEMCKSILPSHARFCGRCGRVIRPVVSNTLAAPSIVEHNVPIDVSPTVSIFFSYAHRDKWLRDRLEDHLSNLKYRGLITTWYDREISAGQEWAQQIDIYLNKAQIILLLISAHFMASEYCYSIEMKRALERHERREADVIPILLRPVLFTDAPFAKLQMLPTNGKPVIRWRDRDSAFVDIAYGIERIAQKYSLSATSTRSVSPIPTAQAGGSWGEQSAHPVSLKGAGSTVPTVSAGGSWGEQSAHPHPVQRSRPVPRISSGNVRLLPIGIVVSVVGLAAAGIFVLSQHPNLIPLVEVIVGSLILLVGIFLAIRVLVKRVATQRREQEQTQIRQLEAARRREQEQTLRRRLEEAHRHREREEAQRREQERVYYEKALSAYEQALHQINADATAYRGKGNALVGLERYNEALTAFEQAVMLKPLPSVYVSMGNVLATLGRCDEAMAAYKQALALEDTYVSAYTGMSKALLQLGRMQEAEQMREQAKQLGDDD